MIIVALSVVARVIESIAWMASLLRCALRADTPFFYQVLRHGRSAGEIIELALERIFANSLKGKLNRPVFMRIVTQYLFGTEKDLCGVIAIPTLMHSFFRGNWLRNMEHFCHVYDARFLRRFILYRS